MPVELIRLIAVVLLLVQGLAAASPAGSVLCFHIGSCNDASSGQSVETRETTLCCRPASCAPAVPTPIPADEKCPPDCGCCVDVPVPDKPLRSDVFSVEREFQRAVADCDAVELPCCWKTHAVDQVGQVLVPFSCGPPLIALSVAISSTRLII